jgi:hypothetical protein
MRNPLAVMPALVAGIHALDGRDKPGHDAESWMT